MNTQVSIAYCTLIFLWILRYSAVFDPEEYFKNQWIQQCFQDENEYPTITFGCCTTFLDQITIDVAYANYVNQVFGSRGLLYGSLNGERVVIKRMANSDKLERLLPKNKSSYSDLLSSFTNPDRIEGTIICPNHIQSTERFLKQFSTISVNSLILLSANPEVLLLPKLNYQGFDVPKIYSRCGLTYVESFDGEPLFEFYKEPWSIRVQFVKKLFQAAERFTNGGKGFRFYLTDVNPDNIVIDRKTHRLSFIDLDTLIIVDSLAQITDAKWRRPHYHEHMDCDNCFSYIPRDICSHSISDINYYAICHLLKDRNSSDNSLLMPPTDLDEKKYSKMKRLIDKCLKCNEESTCKDRTLVIKQLIELLETF